MGFGPCVYRDPEAAMMFTVWLGCINMDRTLFLLCVLWPHHVSLLWPAVTILYNIYLGGRFWHELSNSARTPQDVGGDMGCAEHIRGVWDMMESSGLLCAKGRKVTMRRWFSWVEGMIQFLPKWHSMLLALTHLGIKSGLYCQYNLPFMAWLRGELAQFDEAAGEGADDIGGGERDLKIRKKFKSTLLMTSRLLADSMRHRRCVLLCSALRPMFTAHSKELKGLRAADSCVQNALGWHLGNYRLVYQKIFKLMADRAFLKKMGFRMGDAIHLQAEAAPGGSGSGSSSSRPAEQAPRKELELDMQYEDSLCTDVFRMCFELVRQRSASMSHWQSCLPNMFVGLLSNSEATRQATLDKLSLVWRALDRAEVLRHRNSSVEQLLEAMRFP